MKVGDTIIITEELLELFKATLEEYNKIIDLLDKTHK